MTGTASEALGEEAPADADTEPTGLTGRHPGDRRVRVSRVASPPFRYRAPGVLTAQPAALAPRGTGETATGIVRRALFGRPLATEEESEERLSKVKALAVFSSDNLSSVAYATESIMFTLLVLGSTWMWLTMPISILIVGIFAIIVVSYRQTIRAYPSGGGSYIVAKENLGTLPSLLAAAALLTDYVLTVSVSVAAGVAAITSAFPGPLADFRVAIASVFIVAIMLVNLRGIRESGTIFALPTYVFLVTTMALVGIGLARMLVGDPPTVTGVAMESVAIESLSLLLLMRAFADGCSAITGVEAISNGVPAFKTTEWRNARLTLTVMGVLVAVMFLGISALALGAGAQPSTHETVLSQLGRAVFGVGPIYYVFQLATTGILILAANTSFADFPRLASFLARDGFMPSRFAYRGERLAFSAGIVALAVLSIVVLAAFGGRVEALIPLYAIGVFTSITVSQIGMVGHWLREQGDGWRRGIWINGIGAAACALVALIFAVAKFALGAWLIIVLIPVLIGMMLFVHRQYERRRLEVHVRPEVVIGPPHRGQQVFLPVADLTRDVVQSVKFARTMAEHVTAVHATDDVEAGEALRERFARQLPGVDFVIVESPYRKLVRPLVRYFEQIARGDGDDVVIVLLPEYVPRHWWERFLYNENAHRIREELLGRPDILVANVPFRRA
jgi:amino acid transporter